MYIIYNSPVIVVIIIGIVYSCGLKIRVELTNDLYVGTYIQYY